jgi:hypothetical protein
MSTGKIEVHSPHKLESDVLHKYYRHSKFASFQVSGSVSIFGILFSSGGKEARTHISHFNLPLFAAPAKLLWISKASWQGENGTMFLCERRHYRGSHQCTTRQGKDFQCIVCAALVHAFAIVHALSLITSYYTHSYAA